LLKQPLEAFRCPSDSGAPTNQYHQDYATSNYVISEQIGCAAPSAVGNPYGPNGNIKIAAIFDGTSNTLMIAERSLVTDPQGKRHVGSIVFGRSNSTDAAFKFRSYGINYKNTPFTSSTAPGNGDGGCIRHSTSSAHVGGVQYLMCDGAVRFINENISMNPAAYDPAGCDPTQGPPKVAFQTAGPTWTYQNLYFINDGNPVGEF
jgi:hypothetical protein